MIHQLKTNSKFFEAVADGSKTFEVRKNDRDFYPGDYLALNELAAAEEFGETGRCMLVRVTYVLSDTEFCKDGFVVMGIEPCAINHAKETAEKIPDHAVYGRVRIYGVEANRDGTEKD